VADILLIGILLASIVFVLPSLNNKNHTDDCIFQYFIRRFAFYSESFNSSKKCINTFLLILLVYHPAHAAQFFPTKLSKWEANVKLKHRQSSAWFNCLQCLTRKRATGERRSLPQALGAHRHAYFSHLNTRFCSRNLNQMCLKMRWEKSYKIDTASGSPPLSPQWPPALVSPRYNSFLLLYLCRVRFWR